MDSRIPTKSSQWAASNGGLSIFVGSKPVPGWQFSINRPSWWKTSNFTCNSYFSPWRRFQKWKLSEYYRKILKRSIQWYNFCQFWTFPSKDTFNYVRRKTSIFDQPKKRQILRVICIFHHEDVFKSENWVNNTESS